MIRPASSLVMAASGGLMTAISAVPARERPGGSRSTRAFRG
jgi:hypothetical protein